MVFKLSIKPSDIYFGNKPTVPEGYKVVDFRIPFKNEYFINSAGFLENSKIFGDFCETNIRYARFILEKLEEKYTVDSFWE